MSTYKGGSLENLFDSRVNFRDAIDEVTQSGNQKNLLLGNGFSIACRPDVFGYESIFKEADFLSILQVQKVFTNLNTEDFEEVIGALENVGFVVGAYPSIVDPTSLDTWTKDASETKKVLIKTIGKYHPENHFAIDDNEYTSCIAFLRNFLQGKDAIFTLNYDLLLYWVLLEGQKRKVFDFCDGCGRDNTVLQWGKYKSSQNTYFLHGALHFFDYDDSIVKIESGNNGSIMPQVGTNINLGHFPIYVAEGTSKKKIEKINHNSYLYHAFENFRNRLESSEWLFTYGVRFSGKDKHIVDTIAKSRLKCMYFGVYDDKFSNIDQETRDSLLIIKGSGKDIIFYDTKSFNPWRD